MSSAKQNDDAFMSLANRTMRWAGIDRALFYAVAMRAWQFFAGPVTLLLVARFFTPAVQGYYYTFASLVALQSFVELGFHIVIMNVTSHEWAHLRLDDDGRPSGSPEAMSRLASFARLIVRWYAVASLLFVVVIGTAGHIFLSLQPQTNVAWTYPWFVLVVASGLSLWALPFHSLLEGCGQIATVNRFRFIQAIAGNIAVWICIPLGAELWTVVAIALVKLGWEGYLLFGQFGRFFRALRGVAIDATIAWKEEVWPLQWRLAVQGVFGYFTYSLLTPLMFHYHGPVTAGQMGMTWTIVTTIQFAAMAWVQTRAPQFGTLAAKRDYAELDRLFWRLTLVSLAVMISVGGAFCAVLFVLQQAEIGLATRLVSPIAAILLTLAVTLQHVPNCQAIYVRAHKREMFLVLGVVSNLAIGTLVWFLGSQYGPVGAAIGYTIVVVVYIMPSCNYLWIRCRRERSEACDPAE